MSLRITVVLLAVLSPIGLRAADDGSDLPSSYPAPQVTQNPFDALDLDALQRRTSVGGQFMLLPVRPGYEWGSLENADSLFKNNADYLINWSREFPFSPRRVHQLNYDTGIPGTVQYSSEFANPADALPSVNITGLESSLPVIIPAGGTANDTASVIEQAAAVACDGACPRCGSLDECPIEVVLAEDLDAADCGEPAHVAVVPLGQDPLVQLLFGGIRPANASFHASTGEDCSQAEPPLKAKVEHLLEAARHLAGAGYEDEAKLFRVEAEAIQKASTRLLTEKRQELERLQQEIMELEELTGQYQGVQVNCRILELTIPQACQSNGDIQSLLTPGVHVLSAAVNAAGCAPASQSATTHPVHKALQVLQDHPRASIKTIAQPSLLTRNGTAATFHSGGEFPILIPVGAERGSAKAPQASIEWRDFGIKLQAVPFIQGNGKVRLSLVTEVADRDFKLARQLNGISVPGLTTRRFHSDIETRFGDTVAVACNSAAAGSDGERMTLLVLVTAQQISTRPGCDVND